jgi:hypothetical protein
MNRIRARSASSGEWATLSFATLDLDFAADRYRVGSAYYRSIADLITATSATFTRASSGWTFDASGTLQSFSSGAARRTDAGLLMEEARTNSIRNNSMTGAAAGTPGTLPTNWAATTLAGLSQEIVGTGTEFGLPYIDLRFSGTSSFTFVRVPFEAAGIIAANNSTLATWTNSLYYRVMGTPTNLAGIGLRQFGLDAGLVITETLSQTNLVTFASSIARLTYTATFTNASTAWARPFIDFAVPNGAAVDFTVRIYAPQFELGTFATSPILTTSAAVARAADVFTIPTAAAWYTAGAGTLFARGVPRSNTGGSASRRFLQFDDGTANERHILAMTTANAANYTAVDGGATQADITVSTGVAANSQVNVAAAFNTNTLQLAANNTQGTEDTSGTLPTVTTLRLGNDQANATAAAFNAVLSRVAYGNGRLANADLQALTT